MHKQSHEATTTGALTKTCVFQVTCLWDAAQPELKAVISFLSTYNEVQWNPFHTGFSDSQACWLSLITVFLSPGTLAKACHEFSGMVYTILGNKVNKEPDVIYHSGKVCSLFYPLNSHALGVRCRAALNTSAT
jgi:hypothetical protein